MEKRVLIAVLLSIVVMYGYSFLVTAPPRSKTTQTEKPAQQQLSAVQPLPVSAVNQAPLPAVSPGTKDVVVETGLYTAVFSTSGASLKKLVLKKYKTTTALDAKPIAMIDENSQENFSLKTLGSGIPIDPAAVYSVNTDTLQVNKEEKKTLEFITSAKTGDYVKKIFTFSGESYIIGLEQQVANTSGTPQEGNLQLVEKNHYVAKPGESRYEVHGPTTFADNALHTQSINDLAKGAKTFEKNVLWSGFEDKYFLGAAIAENSSIASVQVRQNNGYVENVISSPRLSLAPGATGTVSYRLYFGPKDLDILKAQGSRLEEVIDFGWFSAIAKPLLHTLQFFYKYVHNYGVAIIIITIILKALFYPLTNKSYKSMKDMQKLQPKMAELKEKYKNDRDAMNKAVMELYKTQKVNPMGGCLPMVIQIPVFFALYKALMFSIELRHAPFMLWIQDLSAPDALFGVIPAGLPLLGGFPVGPLPLLMGATMVIQQKMTPSNMDPAQAKMMMALPFVFTFMFLNFPSGLVLYWLVNNILTIAQQAYINKTLKGN
jgi:YidC/Oxa1 family membrane protein insertase